MMRQVFSGALLALMLNFPVAIAAGGPEWQSADVVKVTLALRSKFGTTPYTVEFKATSGGKTYTAKKENKADQWVYAVFPDDFGSVDQTGKYQWEAVVDGKRASSGWFTYKTLKTRNNGGVGDTQVTLHDNIGR